jgi:MFS transporter, DHA2 family, multidrug resistance protein
VDRSGARAWAGLAALALPSLLIALDLTVLHLAIPEIAADLRPGPVAQLWIVDAYGFAVAGLLLTMGNLGDRIGRRRLLMIGAAGFASASVLAAFAPSPGLLIAARVLLGIAGATLMPSTLSLIRDLFPDDRRRTVAISVWMASLLSGTALGPLVGGVLLEWFWWGSVFLIAVPVMGALLLVGPRLLPAGERSDAGPIDLPSVALTLTAVLPAVYAVKEAAAHGVAPVTPLLLAVSVAGGWAFRRRQLTLRDPLLDLALFRDRRFSAATGIHLGALLVTVGIQYLFALYLQLVVGLSPLTAGLWTLVPGVVGMLGAVAAPFAAYRLGPGTAIAAGLASATAGVVVVTQTPADGGLAVAVCGFALTSASVNLVTSLTTDRLISAAPPHRAGMASGMSETAAELGIALGIALLGSLATAVQTSRTNAPLVPGAGDEVREAFTTGLQVSAGVGAIVLAGLTLLAVRVLRERPRLGDRADADHGVAA